MKYEFLYIYFNLNVVKTRLGSVVLRLTPPDSHILSAGFSLSYEMFTF